MKVYCKQVKVEWVNAVTPMRLYDVVAEDGQLKVIEDNEGDLITIHLTNCQFSGACWFIKECN